MSDIAYKKRLRDKDGSIIYPDVGVPIGSVVFYGDPSVGLDGPIGPLALMAMVIVEKSRTTSTNVSGTTVTWLDSGFGSGNNTSTKFYYDPYNLLSGDTGADRFTTYTHDDRAKIIEVTTDLSLTATNVNTEGFSFVNNSTYSLGNAVAIDETNRHCLYSTTGGTLGVIPSGTAFLELGAVNAGETIRIVPSLHWVSSSTVKYGAITTGTSYSRMIIKVYGEL